MEKQPQLAVRAGLEPGPSGFQIRRPTLRRKKKNAATGTLVHSNSTQSLVQKKHPSNGLYFSWLATSSLQESYGIAGQIPYKRGYFTLIPRNFRSKIW